MKEQQPRWKRGVNTLNGNLGEMLGKLYVERHFKPEAKARMEALVANLRDAYREGIDKLEWMGPETKKQAQEKLARFTPKIGYPEQVARLLEARDQEGRSGRQHHARLRAREHYQLGKAGKPIDPEQWGMTPQTINAYYNPVRNEIVFPAAILQPPFFNLEADDAVNYGGIGARHRPRDGPRLRRSGPSATTPTARCATGGRKQTPRNTRSAPRCSSSSSTSSSRCPDCTSTAS